jgi:uncharacterized damage-inducible protein DinB
VAESEVVITPDALLKHWQGHRARTRRMIEAFPETELFNFTIGGMRPFSELAMEFLGMATPTLKGVVRREWAMDDKSPKPSTKAELLERWDAATQEINELWNKIPEGRFQETDTAFGQWTMPVYDLLLYIIDNEVHHRGQGYVYLRALGIDPPPFYERG